MISHSSRTPFAGMYFSPDERSGGSGNIRTIHPNMTKPFTAADLPMSEDGTMYHIAANAEHIANHILVVGDPHRAKAIGDNFFSSTEFEIEARGLQTVTGIARATGQRVTVCTHQMGTGSTEIVTNELFALASVDAKTRLLKPREQVPTRIIGRVGTSGIVSPEVPVGTLVITRLSVGLDNSAMFTEVPISKELQDLEDFLYEKVTSWTPEGRRFKGKIFPYVSIPDQTLTDLLVKTAKEKSYAFVEGITISNSGFFASQGRDVLYSPPTIPDIDRRFYELGEIYQGLKFMNMEMEASLINHLGAGNGHRTAAICVGIANRAEDTFDHDYQEHVKHATEVMLEAFSKVA